MTTKIYLMNIEKSTPAGIQLANDPHFLNLQGKTLRSNTSEAYKTSIDQYTEFCENKGYDTKDEVSALAFLNELSKEKSYNTVATRFYAIRYYFNQNNINFNISVFNNFLKALANAKVDRNENIKKKTPALTKEKINEHINELNTEYQGIVWLIYYGAFRVSELIALTTGNIEQSRNGFTITINTAKNLKAGKTQYKFIKADTPAGRFLLERLQETDQNKRLIKQSRQTINTVITRKFKGYNAHSLRAGFITDALNNGASIEEVCTQTGQSLATAQSYYNQIRANENNAVNYL